MSVFSRFAPRLQEAIASRLGWTSLRSVQEQAGEALLDGSNAVILAPTAGGKTEASMFPTLSELVTHQPEGVGVIYIAPIKALLNNQAERLGLYTEMVGLRRFVWHGDVPTASRRRFLREPAELLMTTPESLEVMLVSQRVNERALFKDLRTVVIDEVHALAGTDRGAHLLSVIERIARVSKHDVQRVGLSATVGNPDEILGWLQGSSKRPGRVVDPPKPPSRKQLLVAHRRDLETLARDAARIAKGQKSLFFCQSRATAEAVAEHMSRAGNTVFVHHSAVSREERLLAEENFHKGSDACIVCTSTLELGIDVGDLDKVFQAEAPDTVSSFLQRMGRTGRRSGQVANATFFTESIEGVLQATTLIELAKDGWVEHVRVDRRCWPVLIHQLLAMALAHDGVSATDAWAHLSSVPDFQGIYRAEFDRLVAWLIKDETLRLASGRLIVGPKAERKFGRRNFMELFSVFTTPQAYLVQTANGHEVGTLTQEFVDMLVDGISCFLLGGRPWSVQRVHHDARRVFVEPAPRGRQPTWGGILPQFLSLEICQRTLAILRNETLYPYLDEAAESALTAFRSRLSDTLSPERGGIEFDAGEIRWWTFAGGRINTTLRHALLAVGGDWQIVPDNFVIKIRGEHIEKHHFDEALARLRDAEFWEDRKLWTEVAEALPSYRISKFQPLMPPWVEREVLASYMLDVGGAWRWLSGRDSSLGRFPIAAPAADVQQSTAAKQLEPSWPLLNRDERRALLWVRNETDLKAAVAALFEEPVIGLDVETTLEHHSLCLVQIAGRATTYLIDPFEVADLEPLRPLLASTRVTKLIHYAPFEREVLGNQGYAIDGVLDTRDMSRALHPDIKGHSLREVCIRELGCELDKNEQTGDWTVRPLTPNQVTYAALDAEVLLVLYDKFRDELDKQQISDDLKLLVQV